MTSQTLSKQYDPRELEQALYDGWERAGYFAPSGTGPPYCIVIPPPNVTGSLHMGHAFQLTIMDALIRYHRMHGFNTLWQAGSDHAGIATQIVVENQLAAEGSSRHDLGRERFVERVWKWKEHSGGTIQRQMRRMGASLDWTRERFTMDEGLSAAVREVFVRLYADDLIYRGKRLVNWDPVLHTAVSDLEVVSEEEDGHLWYIRYPVVDGVLADGTGHVVVATTRPETMLGDVAVAVHPDDDRYRTLVGGHVELPLTGRTIPVIADDYVDREFGTGCLKITPAHDFNDYEVGQRHGLARVNIFDGSARVSLPDSPYDGLDRFEARKRVLADLEEQGLLERTEPHRHTIPRGDRSGSVIEPWLTDQWFVRAKPLAEESIRVVEDGRIRFVPEGWSRTYYEWMHNIQDWCISRQIWWGHRIPAWYDGDGHVYVAREEEEAQRQAAARHGEAVELTQDPDVLDTWFSSALWPFSTLGWPEDTPELRTFYPTTVLVTGFDIIFFWVARMIMFGLPFAGDVPFRDVYIHGLVRDSDGQKMSKSKGNILDPLDLIDGIDLEGLIAKRTSGLMQPRLAERIEATTRKHFPQGIPAHGTDALRFTFASLATQGRDIRFDLGRIEGYRNFCNKLWNAARYVLMNTEGHDCGIDGSEVHLSVADRWIVSRLQQVEQQVADAIEGYRFDQVARALYAFIWDEYCSWYLELAKITLTDDAAGTASLRGTRRTLVRVLETLLRLLHPIMPFITEAIWQRVAKLAGAQGDTIMLAPWPQPDAARIDAEALAAMQWVQAVIGAVRSIRGEMNIDPQRALPVLLAEGSQQDWAHLESFRRYLEVLGRLESVQRVRDPERVPESATELVGGMKVLIPLGSVIDREAELRRLEREMERLQKDLARAEGKLGNASFVEKAPAEVVEQERQRLTDIRQALAKLEQQRERVGRIT